MKGKLQNRPLYCCGCETTVLARLTDGREIYPHRRDLGDLPFWKCDKCGNYVGCHHKTRNRTRPLGVIPTKELRKLRQEIHKKLAVIEDYGMTRNQIYAHMTSSMRLKGKFHTAELKSETDAKDALHHAQLLLETRQRAEGFPPDDIMNLRGWQV